MSRSSRSVPNRLASRNSATARFRVLNRLLPLPCATITRPVARSGTRRSAPTSPASPCTWRRHHRDANCAPQITARASPDVWRTCASSAFERLHHVRITQIPRQHATANIERYYSSALRTRRAFCSAKKYSSAAIRPSTRRDPSTRRIRTPAVEAGMRRGRSRRIVQGGLLDPAVHAIGIGQSASTAMTLNPLCVINAY